MTLPSLASCLAALDELHHKEREAVELAYPFFEQLCGEKEKNEPKIPDEDGDTLPETAAEKWRRLAKEATTNQDVRKTRQAMGLSAAAFADLWGCATQNIYNKENTYADNKLWRSSKKKLCQVVENHIASLSNEGC